MRRSISLLFLSLLSCGQKQYTAQECTALAAPKAFLHRCMGGTIEGNYIGDLKCWPFSRPQRLHGVLLILAEASEFFPNANSPPRRVENNASKIWFEADLSEPPPQVLANAQRAWPRAYLVDVEGRLSLCDAWFGHQGTYPREFIVSRFYSARELPVHY